MKGLERKTLGKSGIEVTRVGLGCASLGGMYGDIPEEQAHEVVRRALSLGINDNARRTTSYACSSGISPYIPPSEAQPSPTRVTSMPLFPRVFLSKPFIRVKPPNQQSSASPQSQDLPPSKPNNNPDRDVHQRRQKSESPPRVLGYIPCTEIDGRRCSAIMGQRRVEV